VAVEPLHEDAAVVLVDAAAYGNENAVSCMGHDHSLRSRHRGRGHGASRRAEGDGAVAVDVLEEGGPPLRPHRRKATVGQEGCALGKVDVPRPCCETNVADLRGSGADERFREEMSKEDDWQERSHGMTSTTYPVFKGPATL
jgi:hypothetical protein